MKSQRRNRKSLLSLTVYRSLGRLGRWVSSEWTATDGTKLGTLGVDILSGKLNFEFSDSVYGEVMFTSLDQEDGVAANWTLDSQGCSGDSGVSLSGMGMALVELFSGD